MSICIPLSILLWFYRFLTVRICLTVIRRGVKFLHLRHNISSFYSTKILLPDIRYLSRIIIVVHCLPMKHNISLYQNLLLQYFLSGMMLLLCILIWRISEFNMDLSEKVISQTNNNWNLKKTNKTYWQIIFNEKTRNPDHYKIVYEASTEEEVAGGRG